MLKNFNWTIFVVSMLLLTTAATSEAKHPSKKESAKAAAAAAEAATAAANSEAEAQAARSKCPKCQSAMEVGFALENQGWEYPYSYTSWVRGPIKQSYYTADTKIILPIRSFRCTNCGYLEMYAK